MNFSVESMEEIAFQNHRIVKRRLMEAQGGTEVRRLHIVYFLSRKGRIEHPHLLRVHHLSRNGVRLRDIKRWLGELRGKDMPESFAWSYKRKYKSGYVWQDLLDDDLITPVSDNEYVIKGSEISSINRDFSHSEKGVSFEKDESSVTPPEKDQKFSSSETSMYVSTKSSSEIEEESPTFGSDTSTLTDDSGKLEPDKNSDTTKKEEKTDNSSPFYSTILNKKNKKKVKINEKTSESTTPMAAASSNTTSSEPHFTKSKSYNANGASNLFRNLITCGAIDTNDSAVVVVNKQQQQQQQHNSNSRPFLNMCWSDERNVHSAEICKRDKIGGSQRIFGTPNWTQQQWSGRKSCDGVKDSIKNKSEFRDQRGAALAAYKQVNWPNCSLCEKPFKPEKLHSHMKSCKGMKASSMSKNAADLKTLQTSNGARTDHSASACLLTH